MTGSRNKFATLIDHEPQLNVGVLGQQRGSMAERMYNLEKSKRMIGMVAMNGHFVDWVLQRSRDNDELVRTVHDQQCRKVQAKLRKCRHQHTARKTELQAGTAKIATSVKSMLRKYLAKADSFR